MRRVHPNDEALVIIEEVLADVEPNNDVEQQISEGEDEGILIEEYELEQPMCSGNEASERDYVVASASEEEHGIEWEGNLSEVDGIHQEEEDGQDNEDINHIDEGNYEEVNVSVYGSIKGESDIEELEENDEYQSNGDEPEEVCVNINNLVDGWGVREEIIADGGSESSNNSSDTIVDVGRPSKKIEPKVIITSNVLVKAGIGGPLRTLEKAVTDQVTEGGESVTKPVVRIQSTSVSTGTVMSYDDHNMWVCNYMINDHQYCSRRYMFSEKERYMEHIESHTNPTGERSIYCGNLLRLKLYILINI